MTNRRLRAQSSEIARMIVASLAVSLAGCAHSVHKVDDIKENKTKAIFVDAKQRAVLTAIRPVRKQEVITTNGVTTVKDITETYRAFCAEPSPDVFAVLSQSLSGSASFGRDSASLKAALEGAFSSVESGSTIARTQTIGMLREMMYRTCERYISGALTDLQFPIQAARDQHLMVSMLAIEQLTGVVTPRTVALSGNSTANVGENTSDAVVRLDEAWKNLQKADAAQKSAKADFQKLEDAEPKCSALKAKIDAKTKIDDEKEKKKWTECIEQQAKVTDAEENRGKAAKHYESLQILAAKGGPAATTATGAVTIGADSTGPDPATIIAVADVVRHIVQTNFDQDEFALLCIRVMEKDPQAALGKECLDYMNARIEKKRAQYEAEAAILTEEYDATVDERRKLSESAFSQWWPKVALTANPATADPARLKSFIDKLIVDNNIQAIWRKRLENIKSMTKKEDIQREFGRLSNRVQKLMAP